MPIRMIPLLLFAFFCFGGGAAADEIPKTRDDLLEGCAADNLLCPHLRTLFQSTLSRRAGPGDPAGIPTWQTRIRYITAGLSADGNLLFDDLIESFAIRAGLNVERVTDARSANFALLITSNPDEAMRGNRFRSLVGNAISADERERMSAELKEGFTLTRVEIDQQLQRLMIMHCYAALHPDALVERAGLRLAALIYRCLTSGKNSDAIRPSLLNRTEPVALDAPPYAKMTSLDRALLETMYRDSMLAGSASLAVERLEKKLREQGFGDDGFKR